MRLKSKVVIVTGAGRGIDRGIALRFAKEGAKVAVNDIDTHLVDEVSNEIKTMGGNALCIEADVSQRQEVHNMVQKSLEHFGNIDILVNNAGINIVASIFDLQEEMWDKVFSVNAKGVFLCSKAIIPHMVKQGGGRIINISSIGGKTGDPYQAPYCASKFAIIGFTQVIARELAPHRVTVNAVCPGTIDTPMQDMLEEKLASYLGVKPEDIDRNLIAGSGWGKRGAPDDVASLVIFLASSEADYVTGQAINICGAREFH